MSLAISVPCNSLIKKRITPVTASSINQVSFIFWQERGAAVAGSSHALRCCWCYLLVGWGVVVGVSSLLI